ncbi:MAG: hypothetical protein C5B60_07840 [Chloroflexi bacterium]|nr:MAG: hypothetical protein C5B60_07840 [Chloroflexota bacterium]
MSKREYRDITARHDIAPQEIAELFEWSRRSVRRYANGHARIRAGDALVLRSLDRGYLTLRKLRQLCS